MRIFAVATVLALIGLAATPVLAGPGCSGYRASKITYPATAADPVAPQTPIPPTATGG